MQQHGNDMDDLFRQAAEGYPLNTDGANWQTVHALLFPERSTTTHPKRERRFRWLLSLLPMVLFFHHTVERNNVAPDFSNSQLKRENSRKMIVNISDNKATALSFQGAATQASGKAKKLSVQPRLNNSLSDQHRNASITIYQDQSHSLTNKNAGLLQMDATIGSAESMHDFARADREEQTTEGEKAGKNGDKVSETNLPSQNISRNEAVTEDHQQSRRKRFYAGVLAGPDLTTVKFQTFSKPGFQVGILLGFQLTKDISVEAGALTAKKYYSSRRDYFNSSKVYTPANAKIIAVNGDCRMMELPVSINYIFNPKKNHRWTASAGLSSYLMNVENYQYDYLYLPSRNIVSHQKTYNNQTKNWASVLQFSLVYATKESRVGHFRMAPYYAIPLKGLGYGELPFSSLGIRFALVSKRF
jgi:hypothetical protein